MPGGIQSFMELTLVFISKFSGSLDKPQYHNIDQKHPGPFQYIITQVLKVRPLLSTSLLFFYLFFCCNIHNIVDILLCWACGYNFFDLFANFYIVK